MKYYEVIFTISAPEDILDDVRDVVAVLAGEAGFETFEDTDAGLAGYVQRDLFDQATLDATLTTLPFAGAAVSYAVRDAEDRDWNEQWEQEGFEPVCIDDRLVIHDGRHLPHPAEGQLTVEIDAHLAFGTGNHQTTRLMSGALLALQLEGCDVLDCGTGTGVLAIVALKRGAGQALGYDIDEWSVDNARHNAVINGVDQRFTALHGDATLLDTIERQFDVVLANINRNILLNDLPRMRHVLKPRGTLLLSGFFCDDVPLLKEKAEALGLKSCAVREDGEWACLELKLPE